MWPTQADVLKVVVETLKENRRVCFDGNGYGSEWPIEAKKRGLPNINSTPEALLGIKDDAAKNMLKTVDVHSFEESEARYNVKIERFIKVRMIELETIQEMLCNEVYPAANEQLAKLSATALTLKQTLGKSSAPLERDLSKLSSLTGELSDVMEQLKEFISACATNHDEAALAKNISEKGMSLMEKARKISDDLELSIDDSLWSLPKYRELLYVL